MENNDVFWESFVPESSPQSYRLILGGGGGGGALHIFSVLIDIWHLDEKFWDWNLARFRI